MAINPYSDWLGIDKSIVSPNYFELLGINSRNEDEAALMQSVAEGAKNKLAMLAKVDPVKFAEPVAKLKSRIAKAVAVLSDPKQRRDYQEALARQVQTGAETPSNSGLEKVTTTVPSTPPKKNPPKPPVPPPIAAKPPAHSESTANRPSGGPTVRRVAESEDDIPMAIPIRKSSPTSPPVGMSDQVSKDADLLNVPRFPAAIPDGPEGEDAEARFLKKIGTVSLKDRKRKKLPSWMVGIVTLLLIAGIGGLVWSIQYFTSANNSVRLADKDTPQTKNLTSTPSPETPKSETKPDSDMQVEKIDPSDPIETDLSKDDWAKDDWAKDDWATTEKESAVNDDDQMSVETTNSPNPENANVPTEPSVEKATVQMSGWDVYFANRKIRWIRRLMARREYDKTRVEIASLEKSLERFPKIDLENDRLPDEDSMEEPSESAGDPLVQILIDIESAKDALSRIDQFWMSVKSGIADLPSSAELKFDGVSMILVDKKENGLILRGTGTNYQFSFDFLPLEFARQIVEQGTIADIPTWRLCRAAAMAAEQGTADQLDEIRKLVEASREDGHDVTLLNEFIEYDSAIRVDWDRVVVKQGSERKKIIDSFREQFDYKEIRSLIPEKASQIFDSYFEAEEQDLDVAATLLSEAIDLAIQSRDPYRLEDAMKELGGVANIDETRSQLDLLIKIATAKLSPEQTLKLRRVARNYINMKNQISFPKLTKRLQLLLENLSKEAAIENEGLKSGQLR